MALTQSWRTRYHAFRRTKQRTAIARAVMREQNLILDDSLSSVDTYTEEKSWRSYEVCGTAPVSSFRIASPPCEMLI